VLLRKKDLADGWCDSCGKKLPPALTTPRRSGKPARPGEYPAPAPAARAPTHPRLYKFAQRSEKISMAALLFVIAASVIVFAVRQLNPAPSEDEGWPLAAKAIGGALCW